MRRGSGRRGGSHATSARGPAAAATAMLNPDLFLPCLVERNAEVGVAVGWHRVEADAVLLGKAQIKRLRAQAVVDQHEPAVKFKVDSDKLNLYYVRSRPSTQCQFRHKMQKNKKPNVKPTTNEINTSHNFL